MLTSSLDLAKKDFSMCAEDSIPKFFSRTGRLPDKFEAFFVDYTMIPLMIQVRSLYIYHSLFISYSHFQDRYLTGLTASNTNLEACWRAADTISASDLFGMLH
jgi:hypothetical protein